MLLFVSLDFFCKASLGSGLMSERLDRRPETQTAACRTKCQTCVSAYQGPTLATQNISAQAQVHNPAKKLPGAVILALALAPAISGEAHLCGFTLLRAQRRQQHKQ